MSGNNKWFGGWSGHHGHHGHSAGLKLKGTKADEVLAGGNLDDHHRRYHHHRGCRVSAGPDGR